MGTHASWVAGVGKGQAQSPSAQGGDAAIMPSTAGDEEDEFCVESVSFTLTDMLGGSMGFMCDARSCRLHD